MTDLLRVDDVVVDCVIGVYAEERTATQPLRVSLSLALDAAAAARSGDLNDTVDYARLFGQLRFVLAHGAFRLLETAAEVLCAVALRASPGVDELTLTLSKPRALAGNGLPSLTLTRRRLPGVPSPDDVALLWAGPDASVHHVVLAAGERVQLPPDAAVLDVDDGRQGSALPTDGGASVTGPRTLLVVARHPLGADALVVQRR